MSHEDTLLFPPTYLVMHPNHGRPLWVIGHRLTSIPTTGGFAFADIELTPGIPGPPPHFHDAADELYYVLDGAVQVLMEDEWYTVRRGAHCLVPSGTIHSFQAVGSQPGRFVSIHAPGDAMDALFLDHGIPADEADAFRRSTSKEVVSRLARAASAHDMLITAPKLV